MSDRDEHQPHPAPTGLELIVPFPHGGSTDFTARVLAEGAAARLGVTVEVETCPGDSGIDAMRRLLDAPPERSFLVGTVNTNSLTPVLRADRFSFDYGSSIVPVTRLADFPSIVACSTESEVTGLRSFLRAVKETSGLLRYSTDFLGTNVDVDMIQLARAEGLDLGYRSASGALEILADLEEGRTDLCILNVATMAANRGRYRPLAATSPGRVGVFADVPTLAEAGFPGVGTGNWQGLFAAGGISREKLGEIFAVVRFVMGNPATRQRFEEVGTRVVVSSSPESFSEELHNEMTRWQDLSESLRSIRRLE